MQKSFRGVTAIASTSDSMRIVSGGIEGNVSIIKGRISTPVLQSSSPSHIHQIFQVYTSSEIQRDLCIKQTCAMLCCCTLHSVSKSPTWVR